MKITNTSLLINQDGSIYHLSLRPDQLAETIIVVGDPDRVPEISVFFDSVEHVVRNREFVTHTGYFNKKRISVVSTGIGTDNIDIVINELDALVNVDFAKREIRPRHTALDIVRIGTSGAIQPEIPVGAFALSSYGLGLDNLFHFYRCHETADCRDRSEKFMEHTGWNKDLSRPYFTQGSDRLIKKFENGTIKGITATAPGFYGPQGRVLRIPLADPDLNDKIREFRYGDEKIINFEMETSALYSLGGVLGHNMVTVCALIANRATNEYSVDHKPVIKRLVEMVLDRITT